MDNTYYGPSVPHDPYFAMDNMYYGPPAPHDPYFAMDNTHNGLTPRPPGEQGRKTAKGRKGYNLQNEIGLGNDKERYNAISKTLRNIFIQHLEVGKSWSEQDPVVLWTVKQQALAAEPGFGGFENCWPIDAFGQQHLKNRNREFRLEQEALMQQEMQAQAFMQQAFMQQARGGPERVGQAMYGWRNIQ